MDLHWACTPYGLDVVEFAEDFGINASFEPVTLLEERSG